VKSVKNEIDDSTNNDFFGKVVSWDLVGEVYHKVDLKVALKTNGHIHAMHFIRHKVNNEISE
jgi:hypothetical protein